MGALLFIIVAVFAVVFFVQNRLLARRLDEMAAALEDRKPYLLERSGQLVKGFHLDRLQRALNELVSESAKSRQSQKNQLEQVEQTLGSLKEGVLLVDPQGYIVMANHAVSELFEHQRVVVGQRFASLLKSSRLLELVQQAAEGETPAPIELEIYPDEGGARFFEANATPLPSTGDGDRLVLLVLHDITRLKSLEKMRTEFVGNLSHELRTPITVIKGFVQVLIDDSEELDAEERRSFLERIRNNTARLNRLLEDLLTLTRLESSAGSVNREPVRLHEVITQWADPIFARAEEYAPPATFAVKLEAANDALEADPLRLSQVLDNLVENALKHATGRATIRLETSSDEHGIDVTVVDDGNGIPAADLPHIFERFYRVDKARSRETGGTGLGLSIVNHIVQLHNGEVFAHSGEGETRIGFRLPFAPPKGTPTRKLLFAQHRRNPFAASV